MIDLELPPDFSSGNRAYDMIAKCEGAAAFRNLYILRKEELHDDFRKMVENKVGASARASARHTTSLRDAVKSSTGLQATSMRLSRPALRAKRLRDHIRKRHTQPDLVDPADALRRSPAMAKPRRSATRADADFRAFR